MSTLRRKPMATKAGQKDGKPVVELSAERKVMTSPMRMSPGYLAWAIRHDQEAYHAGRLSPEEIAKAEAEPDWTWEIATKKEEQR